MTCFVKYNGKSYSKEEFLAYYEKNKDDIENPFQLEGSESSKSSLPTLEKVKEWLKRIGVDIKLVSDIVVNGQRVGANGVAKIVQNLIEVLDGKEDTALTEEAAHFAVELIEKENPSLYREMFNSIGGYNIFRETLASYRDQYKTPDGKPDIVRIKKEAIAKLVTEHIILQSEGVTEKPELLAKVQTWWTRVLDAIKSIFNRSTFNPFREAAKGVVEGTLAPERQALIEEAKSMGREISQPFLKELFDKDPITFMREMSAQLHSTPGEQETAEEIVGEGLAQIIRELFPASGSEYLQVNDKQASIYNKLLETHNKITPASDKSNRYQIEGKIIKGRVTDLAKSKFDRLFKDKKLNKTENQQAIDDLKAEKGTAGHADMENIFHRYVDDNGFLRPTELPKTQESILDPNNDSLYETLKDNLVERLQSFPPGTRFLSEIRIYDPNADRAGTMDLVAIEDTGKVHILDWKFMELDTNKFSDVPWYKKDAFNIQIGEYKRILREKYGIKSEQFGQTRAIPIQTIYKYNNKFNKADGIHLGGIKIGKVDPKGEDEAFLLPVALPEEQTGNKKKDAALAKLNGLYKELSSKTVVEGRKDIKAAQLNSLFTAIRQLQIKDNIEPLLQQATALMAGQDKIIAKYKSHWEGKDPQSFTPEEIEAFSDQLTDAVDELLVYASMGVQFDGVVSDPALVARIDTISGQAAKKKAQFEEITKDFANKFIAERVGIHNFLSPERIVKGLKRMFRSFSQSSTAAMQAFYKLETPLRQKAVLESDEENNKLEDLRTRYMDWAKGKGLGPKDMFDLIFAKDAKGRHKHERVGKYSIDFYKTFNKKAETKDKEWFTDNIDIEAYTDYYENVFKPEKFAQIDDQTYDADPDVDNAKKLEKKREIESKFDLTNSSAWGNYKMKQFPKEEKWESDAYKVLKANPVAMEFWSYIGERMKEAAANGAIEERVAGRFLPFMRKSILDKFVFGGHVKIGEQLIREISIDESNIGYGQIDPLTGEIIPTVPFYFKTNLGVTKVEKDENDNEVQYIDYSDVSTDMFEVMRLFNDQLADYKYKVSIENQVKILLRAERLKKSIKTNFTGAAIRENDQIQFNEGPNANKDNAELLEAFIMNRIYGQRYVNSQSVDQTLGKVGNKSAKAINKFFGKEIFPEDLAERQISATRLLDAGNRFFQQKVLGLNVAVPLANLAGGTMQVMINSGRYATKADFWGAWTRVFQKNFKGETGMKYAGLMDYFLPMLDNERNIKARHASVSAVTKFSMADFLMSLQRGSDKLVQYPLAIALMENTMVREGKLINIREYVKEQNNWNGRFSLPKGERKVLEDKVDQEIKKLKETESLPKVAKIVNDELIIPGVERQSEEVGKFREFVQQQAKNAVGNSTQEDSSLIKMNVITNSFMVFKNWIPRLVDVRAGELRYQVGTDSWEYGRTRMFFKVLFSNMGMSISNLYGISVGNERGINIIKEIYQNKLDKWEKENGTKLEDYLTEEQFIDLFREGIRAEVLELQYLLGLTAILFSAKAAAPDDDESDHTKGFYKWSLRAIDKINDELSFYYNPLSMQSIANGSLLPSLGILTDVTRLIQHTGLQTFGFTADEMGWDFGEEWMDKAHPQKYFMKTFPISKEIANYIPIFNKDLADEMGISQTTQARIR